MNNNDYIEDNRFVYDALAEEYAQRAESDRVRDVQIVTPMVDYLNKNFSAPVNVLDLGFGNGINMTMFQEFGVTAHGIDISENMLKVAKQNCPDGIFYLGNFLDYPFSSDQFEGIFAKASIHLFTKEDAEKYLKKCYEILKTKGMLYIATTHSDVSSEGYVEKKDYAGSLKRYRKMWTEEELVSSIKAAGFEIFLVNYNSEPRGKLWLNVWAIK